MLVSWVEGSLGLGGFLLLCGWVAREVDCGLERWGMQTYNAFGAAGDDGDFSSERSGRSGSSRRSRVRHLENARLNQI